MDRAYLCMKDFYMEDDNPDGSPCIAFKQGKVYYFDNQRQTISELGDHSMHGYRAFDVHFTEVRNVSLYDSLSLNYKKE